MARRRQVVMFVAKPYVIDPRVKNEAETLAAAGHQVTVLSWDRSGREPRESTLNGVRVVSRRLLGGVGFSKASFAFSALFLQLFCVAWCLREMKGRYVVHAHDFNTLLAGFFLRKIHERDVRLVYDCHELTPCAYAEWYGYSIGIIAGALERTLSRHVDAIITVSDPIAKYLENASDRSVTLVYNTIKKGSVPSQEKQWLRTKLGLAGFVVSYIGTLRQDVALDEFVEAAHQFEQQAEGIGTFIIVGDGPDLERLLAKSKESGNNIRFIPRVPYQTALAFVKASDISYAVYRNPPADRGLTHSKKAMIEGNTRVAMPWKLFEAMACGTTVMVREDTYTWRFAREVGFGLSAGLGTAEDVVNRLHWVIDNEGELDLANTRAQQAFAETYNWEETSRGLVRLYDGIWNDSDRSDAMSPRPRDK